jgi:sugar (pentulose or hexulose) kinase
MDSTNPTEMIPFTSDLHNCLKLGYDVRNDKYPEWLLTLLQDIGLSNPQQQLLPAVYRPGSVVGPVGKNIVTQFDIPATCQLVAGTTDSIAAFVAAGVTKPGQAVSSLGSTLAIKLLSTEYVEDSARGVYSHRLGDLWLVGGASNVGCAVLRQQGFTDADLMRLSDGIDPNSSSGLQYYPLTSTGERFPIADSLKAPVLDPKPVVEKSDSECADTAWRRWYLHGILEGISEVERQGYQQLNHLGATPVTEVRISILIYIYICVGICIQITI